MTGTESEYSRLRYYRTPTGGAYPEHHVSAGYREKCTPVVVIDPANRDDVQLMIDAVRAHGYVYGRDPSNVPDMRTALRSLIEPPKPPKLEEPTGLGAVVEDAEGQWYVRVWAGIQDDPYIWRRANADELTIVRYTWNNIAAVKELSKGV